MELLREIFLYSIIYFLLPIIPAVLFYVLTPEVTKKKAEAIGDFGPITFKFGGSAVLFAAFFLLLQNTPLIEPLIKKIEKMLVNNEIHLTGDLVFQIPSTELGHEAVNEEIDEVIKEVLSNAPLEFIPNFKIVQADFRHSENLDSAIFTFKTSLPAYLFEELKKSTRYTIEISGSQDLSKSNKPISIDINSPEIIKNENDEKTIKIKPITVNFPIRNKEEIIPIEDKSDGGSSFDPAGYTNQPVKETEEF